MHDVFADVDLLAHLHHFHDAALGKYDDIVQIRAIHHKLVLLES